MTSPPLMRAVIEVYHMDEFAESLLHDDRVCDIMMPAIQACCAAANQHVSSIRPDAAYAGEAGSAGAARVAA